MSASRPRSSASGPAAAEVVIANRHPRLRFAPAQVQRLFEILENERAAITGSRPPSAGGELSIVFLTDRALARLHAEYLDDPSTTDVITFPGEPLVGTAGEICVSADTAAAYARAHGRDFSTELTLYLVHGWLHLAGYDDLQPVRKRAMRRAEGRGLRALTRAGAIPRFTLRRPRKTAT